LKSNYLESTNKKSDQIKLNKDLDLYPLIIELSSFLNIEEFINGFYDFTEIKPFYKNITLKEDLRKDKIKNLIFILDYLRKLIDERIENYHNNSNVKNDYSIFEEAKRKKDFNMLNISNVILEEKKVIFIFYIFVLKKLNILNFNFKNF